MAMMELNPQLNYAPDSIKHIHIMGICGTGMAALAGMLHSSGCKITGSDSHIYPPMSDFLQELGIAIYDGYSESNLRKDSPPDLVIVGNVITRKNPEAIALSETSLPYLSFPQALAHFFIRSRTSLVVAGTHGKTTTCSLLASSLYSAGLDPTFMVGGIVKEFSANFRLGRGSYFVAEGDEYDTAFFDKESKFLHYIPKIAILTSIEFDHADIFDNLEQIKAAFAKFVQLIPKNGLLIANFDDENVREIVALAKCKVQSYGLLKQDDSPHYWSLGEHTTKDGATVFKVYKEGKFCTELNVAMAGRHNCLNSLAVTAVLHHIGIDFTQIGKGLSNFAGVKRRQEVRGTVGGITVIDDFAHHPTAVYETLSALHNGYPNRRLIAVFEPRTNSSRRAIFQKEYIDAFSGGAAEIILLREPLPIDGLKEKELFSSAQLAKDLRERDVQAKSFADTNAILLYLQEIMQEGDVVAVLSNGGFDNIHIRLLALLEE